MQQKKRDKCDNEKKWPIPGLKQLKHYSVDNVI